MKNRKMQEEMFRAMFRLKHLSMGGMLKEISVGEYKILEMCSGCPQCGAREKGIYVSSMAAEMKGFFAGRQPSVERHGGQSLYCPSCGLKGPEEYPCFYHRGRTEKTG